MTRFEDLPAGVPSASFQALGAAMRGAQQAEEDSMRTTLWLDSYGLSASALKIMSVAQLADRIGYRSPHTIPDIPVYVMRTAAAMQRKADQEPA